jgi:hypothetical protein
MGYGEKTPFSLMNSVFEKSAALVAILRFVLRDGKGKGKGQPHYRLTFQPK